MTAVAVERAMPLSAGHTEGHKSGNGSLDNKITPIPQKSQAKDHVTRLIDFALTDTGIAEAFAWRHGESIRFDHARERWMIFGPHHWQPDKTGIITNRAIETARAIRKAWLTEQDKSEVKEEHAYFIRKAQATLKYESNSNIHAMLSIAQDLQALALSGDEFNRDPWLLGVANGVVDLKMGILRPGKPDDYIALSTEIEYDPEAECPRFELFLEQIFNYDYDLIGFVRRAIGYSLTGSTREQCLFLCYGKGANGKSTLLNALGRILGEYSANTPFSTFEDTRPGDKSPTNDVAALAGARLVTSSESSETKKLNESRVKAITGGDPVTARFLYGEHFTYKPGYKIWLAANHKPEIKGTDDGIWRRVRLIPFEQSFKGDKADPNLEAILESELSGILAWAVKGCIEWQESGLQAPKVVSDATAAYRAESNNVAQFVKDCCVITPKAIVGASELHQTYVKWANDCGEDALDSKGLKARLEEIDGVSWKHRNSGNVYLGITLTVESEG